MALAALLFVTQAVLWLFLKGSAARAVLNDWAMILGGVGAIAGMAYGAYYSNRLDRRLGRVWGLFTLAAVAWLTGDLTWAWLDRVNGVRPYPSFADIFHLCGYLLFLLGILRFPRSPGEHNMQWLWLDILVIMVSVGGIYWNFILPDLQIVSPSPTYVLVASIYPLGDLLLILSITLVIFRPSRSQWFQPFLWLLGAYMLVSIADSFYSILNITRAFEPGQALSLLFSMEPLLLMISGFSQAVHVQRALHETRTVPFLRFEEPLRLLRLLLPFLWLLLAYGLVSVYGVAHHLDGYPEVSAWIGIILLLMVIRETVVLMDNDQLAGELRSLNDTLEKRVAERASTLTVSNYELRREMEERRRVEAMLREREERLAYFALHDALTGLPNRALLTDRLSQAIQRHQRHPEERYAVLFLDFDSFKVVNDSLGHAAGDQLLVQIGQRLMGLVRSSDTVARLGGDEFIVLIEGFRVEGFVTVTAQRILDAFLDPFSLNGHVIYITASIGVVISQSEYQSAVEIIRDADLAMYAAKSNGKAHFRLFSPEMRHAALNRLTLEADLHHALDWHELSLHYQPIHELATGHVHGLEALVRWHHPTRGLIGPSEFIPIAEMSGFISTITHWMLHEACRQLADWQANLPPRALALTLSLNLSPSCMRQPELLHWFEQSMRLHSILPQQVHVEIVETTMLEEVDLALRVFSDMRRLGLKISLDDFGVGYSSLSYLTQYPIDILKIDRSFISRAPEAPEVASVVRAICALARELKIDVVAEGVETQAQLDLVREAGCRYAQGNLLCPPLCAEDIGALLEKEL